MSTRLTTPELCDIPKYIFYYETWLRSSETIHEKYLETQGYKRDQWDVGPLLTSFLYPKNHHTSSSNLTTATTSRPCHEWNHSPRWLRWDKNPIPHKARQKCCKSCMPEKPGGNLFWIDAGRNSLVPFVSFCGGLMSTEVLGWWLTNIPNRKKYGFIRRSKDSNNLNLNQNILADTKPGIIRYLTAQVTEGKDSLEICRWDSPEGTRHQETCDLLKKTGSTVAQTFLRIWEANKPET